MSSNEPFLSNPYNPDFKLIKIDTSRNDRRTKYDVKTYNRIIKKVGVNIKRRRRLPRNNSTTNSISSRTSESSRNSLDTINVGADEDSKVTEVETEDIKKVDPEVIHLDISDSTDGPGVRTRTKIHALKKMESNRKSGDSNDPSLQTYIVLSDIESDDETVLISRNKILNRKRKKNASEKPHQPKKPHTSKRNVPIDFGDKANENIGFQKCKVSSKNLFFNSTNEDASRDSFYNADITDPQIVPIDSLRKVFESINDTTLPTNLPITDHQSLMEKLQELKQIRYNHMVNLLQETSENFITMCKLEKEKLSVQYDLSKLKYKEYYEKLLYEQEKEIEKKQFILDDLLKKKDVKASST